MKKFVLLFMIFIYSCSSVKIKEENEDSTLLQGKVKRIEATSLLYSVGKDNTPSNIINSDIFYDKKNRIIKQFDCYNTTNCDSTIFKYDYNSGFLVNIINSKVNDHETYKIVYQYDINGNERERYEYLNDTLYDCSFNLYDKINRRIKSTSPIHFGKKNTNVKVYSYNDKERKYTVRYFKEGHDNPTSTFNIYYNKKGYVIKKEQLNKDSNFTLFCNFEYDHYDNFSKQVFYDENNKVKFTNTFKRIFDKKGNVINKESYQNGNLYEKIIYKITYW